MCVRVFIYMYMYIYLYDWINISLFFFLSGVPSRPKGPLEVIKVSYDFIDLEWKAPESDGGTPITKYIVEYRSVSRLSWFKGMEVEPNVFVTRILNLVEGTEYLFRVIAVNEEGESPPLETTEATTPTREKCNFLIFSFSFILFFISLPTNFCMLF